MARESETGAALDAILAWRAPLDNARGKSRWGGGEEIEPGVHTLPFCVLPEDVVEFLLDLDRHGLLRTDYRQHVTRLRPAIDDPAQIETLSAEDCLHLLTYHVRADRFVDGHLARVLDRGDLSAILSRLAEIRESDETIGRA